MLAFSDFILIVDQHHLYSPFNFLFFGTTATSVFIRAE